MQFCNIKNWYLRPGKASHASLLSGDGSERKRGSSLKVLTSFETTHNLVKYQINVPDVTYIQEQA